jgi:hypothetical protein
MNSKTESEQKPIESSSIAAEATKKTDSALRSTAQKYISSARVDEEATSHRRLDE